MQDSRQRLKQKLPVENFMTITLGSRFMPLGGLESLSFFLSPETAIVAEDGNLPQDSIQTQATTCLRDTRRSLHFRPEVQDEGGKEEEVHKRESPLMSTVEEGKGERQKNREKKVSQRERERRRSSRAILTPVACCAYGFHFLSHGFLLLRRLNARKQQKLTHDPINRLTNGEK